jgi:membrane protein YqaA with SNARE-associated domain
MVSMAKLKTWVMNWANTPFAAFALLILAFSEAVFFPVPPDILLVVLVLAFRTKAFKYALFCTIGSVAGAMVGYSLGHYIWLDNSGNFTWFANIFFNNIPGFSMELFSSVKELYDKWDFWIIFTGGFAPIPYKIFTITAGVFDINMFMFFLTSAVSRGLRYLIIAFLLWKFGAAVKLFMEKYYKRIAFGFTLSILCGFILVKYIL